MQISVNPMAIHKNPQRRRRFGKTKTPRGMHTIKARQSKRPVLLRNRSDPGDDVARRFSYQHGYGVVLLCGMVTGANNYLELYCEQHEDFLAKIGDNTYDAIQIKTSTTATYWSISDKKVINSVKRFLLLESERDGAIRRYIYVGNIGDPRSNYRDDDFAYVTAILQGRIKLGKNKSINRSINILAKNCECSRKSLEALLKRTDVVAGPGLNDFTSVIAHEHLAKVKPCEALGASFLTDVTKSLMAEVSRASSLVANEERHLCPLVAGSEQDPYIINKRITAEMVGDKIRSLVGSRFVYLPGFSCLNLSRKEGTLDVLSQKMLLGGIDHYCESLRRQVLSAENSLIEQSMSDELFEEKLSHLESVVLVECHEAHARASLSDKPFGLKMYTDVQDRLKSIAASNTEKVHGQSYETLMGISGLLAQECKVWWSIPHQGVTHVS